MIEEWKDVIGGDGRYQISNLGNLKSLVGKGKFLKPRLSKVGYFDLGLTFNGERKTRTVHSLVAEHFLGPKPNGLQIDHKDNCRTNNCVSNLEYVTPRENTRRGKACKLKGNRTSEFIGVSYDVHKKGWTISKNIKKSDAPKDRTIFKFWCPSSEEDANQVAKIIENMGLAELKTFKNFFDKFKINRSKGDYSFLGSL